MLIIIEESNTIINMYFYKKAPNMFIFVAGLPYDLDDAELEEIFEKFGTVKSAKVTIDRETGKSRGFGFVEMPDSTEANDAIENLNDISLGKKPLVVKAAEDRGGAPGGGGRGAGALVDLHGEIHVMRADGLRGDEFEGFDLEDFVQPVSAG